MGAGMAWMGPLELSWRTSGHVTSMGAFLCGTAQVNREDYWLGCHTGSPARMP